MNTRTKASTIVGAFLCDMIYCAILQTYMNKFQLFFLCIRIPLDYATLVCAAVSAFIIRLSEPIVALRRVNIGLNFDDYFFASLVVSLLWIVIFAFAGLYSIDPNRKFGSELRQLMIGCASGFAATAVIIFLRGELFNSRFIVLAASILAALFLLVQRMFMRLIVQWLHVKGIGVVRIAIIGDDDTAKILYTIYSRNARLGFSVVKRFPSFSKRVGETLVALKHKHQLDEIIFTNQDNERETIALLALCEQHQLTFKYSADLFSTYAPERSISVVAGIPLIEIRRTRIYGWGRILKRIMDVSVASMLLIVLSPLMSIIALCILIETGRPILYRNQRVGEKGRLFDVLKFRTMYQHLSIGEQFKDSHDALRIEKKLIEKYSIKQGPLYKIKNDPRVTSWGKIFRDWSLDELPQLLNVVNGSMSLVGPRPHQPREVEKYEPHHKKVLVVKPGMTGLSQIGGRSDLTFEEEMRLDTLYIEQWSLLSDLFILVKTPLAIFHKKGVY